MNVINRLMLVAIFLAILGSSARPQQAKSAPAASEAVQKQDAKILSAAILHLVKDRSKDAPIYKEPSQKEPLYIMREALAYSLQDQQLLSANSTRKLTTRNRTAVREAEAAAIRRSSSSTVFDKLTVAHPGVKVVDQYELRAINEKSHEYPLERDRPVQAYPPGLSKNGQIAVVRLGVPWSIHHADVTYVLKRTNSGWNVVAREGRYYL